ncbi:glucose-6-phosphate exchanger SLC37A4-like [Ruditapes philippinarum]|uniref:glucose-6-phosphate exchanger SLC37A4-like n=1 Tax=Ruditapes philippinarum TaxID=129788 RepID=UPI00295BAD18|nr:glucose-6-phosphate exchanger SLC37A4-like [Ruditapes philippinarum]
MQQKVIFLCLYVSYLLSVYVRRSVTFALPDIATAESLDKNQLGLILSGQTLAYALSKFTSGIMMDFVSPRLAMSVGLILSGISAILFASAHGSLMMFTIFWIMNGLFQGPGWPAAAVIMRKWFKDEQYGTAWSVLSTSMNVAGTLGPLIAAFIITYSSWRYSLLLPGVLAMVFGFIQYVIVRDKPGDYTGDKTKKKTTGNKNSEKVLSRRELLKLPGYLGVCITYGVISLIQYGTLQWAPVYLVNELGHSIITGNSFTSSLEVGGICGSLLAGYYSDYLLTQMKEEPCQNVRQYVIAWFASGLVVFLYMLTYCVSTYSTLMWIDMIGFGLGMTIYGPISIYGVTAIECAPSEMAGTSHAFASLLATVGQSVAGLPLSYFAKYWGWRKMFITEMLLVLMMAGYLFVQTKSCHGKRENVSKPKAD